MPAKNPNRVAAGKYVSGHNIPKTCRHCRRDFRGTAKQVYCSRRCKEVAATAARTPRPCKWCGKTIDPRGRRGRIPLYCSDTCRHAAQYPIAQPSCRWCGEPFKPRRGSRNDYCTADCRKAAGAAAKLASRIGSPESQAARIAAELEKRRGNNRETK